MRATAILIVDGFMMCCLSVLIVVIPLLAPQWTVSASILWHKNNNRVDTMWLPPKKTTIAQYVREHVEIITAYADPTSLQIIQ